MVLYKSVLTFVKRHPIFSSFLIVFPIMLFLNLSQPHPLVFYYDSGQYWEFSESFIKEGVFSITNFDKALRGYLFPLIIFFIRKLAFLLGITDYIMYEIVMSLVFTTFLVIIVPLIIQKLFKIRTEFEQAIVFSLLALFFWKGSFFYPLTDLLAFFSMIMGVFVIINFHGRWWQIAFAGLFWGGASLIRPIYSITLPFFIFWSLYYSHKENPLVYWRVITGRLIALFVGFTIVFAPQLAINITNWEKASPFVLTNIDGPSLFTQQLTRGIVIQKLEGNVGESYPVGAVFFLDRQGESILIKSGNQSEYNTERGDFSLPFTISLSEYLRLVIKYPLDFVTIYARHLFNGLDIVYNSTYIKNVYENAIIIRLLNYSLWFLVVMFVCYRPKLRVQNYMTSQLILPAIFALPAIASIPTAMEVRFMIPIQIMAYALVSFWILPKFFSKDFLQKKILIRKFLLRYIVFITLCFILSANTYAGLQYGPYTLTGN